MVSSGELNTMHHTHLVYLLWLCWISSHNWVKNANIFFWLKAACPLSFPLPRYAQMRSLWKKHDSHPTACLIGWMGALSAVRLRCALGSFYTAEKVKINHISQRTHFIYMYNSHKYIKNKSKQINNKNRINIPTKSTLVYLCYCWTNWIDTWNGYYMV